MKQLNRPSAPLLVTVNVTGACNLTCSYCYFQPRKKKHMAVEDYIDTITLLKEYGVFLLTLSGGDPFMHPKINEMLKLAHKTFKYVSVLTNGTKLTDGHFDTIRQIIDAKGIFPIQVSLDSINPEINDDTRGFTANVLKNLGILNKIGASITVATVISSRNVKSIVETIVSLKDITKHFHIMPIRPVPFLNGEDSNLMVSDNEMSEVWNNLIDIRKKYGLQLRTPIDKLLDDSQTSACGAPCMAGFTKLAIDPNLDIRPCDKLVQTVVGNLKKQSFKEIWEGKELAKVYKKEFPHCYSKYK